MKLSRGLLLLLLLLLPIKDTTFLKNEAIAATQDVYPEDL